MSSTTTAILFNSPALSSLKRDQLLKLCKIHGVKASGKNVDIVARLQQYATTLPPEMATLPPDNSEETTGETQGADKRASVISTSEQWEMVMEAVDETSEVPIRGTLKTMKSAPGNVGDFGTGQSKASGMGSSLKSFASSLGLKRAVSPMSNSAARPMSPSSMLLAPSATHHIDAIKSQSIAPCTPARASRSDGNTESRSVSPIPGTEARPGRPAPFLTGTNVRLSMGSDDEVEGPTTTIRLVGTTPAPLPSPPKLRSFAPAFDLDMDETTPVASLPISSQDDGHVEYPPLPCLDVGKGTDMPGTLEASLAPEKAAAVTEETVSSPAANPFIFGSAHPRHSVSNPQFASAADSVLAEMNRRLVANGSQALNIPAAKLIAQARAGSSADAGEPTVKPRKSTDRFEDAHAKQFAQMESIADHWSNRGKKRKSQALSEPGKAIASGSALRRKAIPSALLAEEEDGDDKKDRRMSKRPRLESDTEEKTEAGGNAKGEEVEAETKAKEEQERKIREREAIRRKLEMNRERRRSRGSLVGSPRKTAFRSPQKAPQPKAGLLSAARSLVKNVLGRTNSGRSIEATTSANVASNSKIPEAAAPSRASADQKKPPLPPRLSAEAKAAAAARAHTNSMATRKYTTGTSSSGASTKTVGRSEASTTRPGSSATSLGARQTTMPSTAASTSTSRTNQTSTTRKASAGSVTSLGAQKRPVPLGILASRTSHTASVNRTRAPSADITTNTNATTKVDVTTKRTSTLTAPTASSLARMQSPPGLTPRTPTALGATTKSTPGGSVLGPVTNSPSKIFSRPLVLAESSPFKVKLPDVPSTIPGKESDSKPRVAGASTLAPKVLPSPARRVQASRTKVTAKVGAQRTTGTPGSGVGTPVKVGASPAIGRIRSSMANAERQSMGGIKTPNKNSSSGPSAAAAALAAKKHIRQNEVARRQNNRGGPSGGMDID